MAKIVLTINANNKATQSVKLLNAEVQTLSKTLSSIKVNKNLTAQINALTKHYKAVADAHAKITANSNKQAIADEKLKQQQSKTALAIAKENTELERQNKIKAQTESITNRATRAKEKDAQSIKLTISQTQKLVKQYADLLNQINAIEKSYKKGTFDKLKNDVSSYFNDVKGLDDSLKSGTITQEDYNSRIIQATASLQGFKTEMATTRTESKNLHGTLKDIVSGFFNFQLGAMLVMKPLQMIRLALSSINETLVKTEDSVIALQRVLPQGSATDGEISSRLYKIAQDYGQTFDNVSQIAENFARTGMSWADTIKATEAAVLALNVAELDATEASEGLISIITQFDMSTAQLTETVDKLNKAADNNPVTTEKLLKALQRTGAAAKNANINLDDTIGIITTLSKATNRSGENLGTAVNSLIQFSSKASSLKVFKELGGDVATAVEKYQAGAGSILDIWEKLGAVIKDRQGNAESILSGGLFSDEDWAGLNEELKEALGESYADVTDIYDTASTFRKNYFIALLNDMENVKKVSGEIANANGYSQDENEKYLKTYTALQNSVQAKWQKIANDAQGILGLKKNLLGAADGILTLINYTGKLNTVFLLAGAAVNKLVGAKLADSLAKQITSWSSLSRVVNAQAKPAIINYTAEIRRLKAEILTTVDSEALLAKQKQLLELRTNRLSTAFKGLSTAISAALIVFAALNAIQGAIDQAEEDRIAKEQEELRITNEKIAKSVESIDENKKLAQSTNEYADTVEKLRETLDSTTASESEKQSAQSQLLAIQNNLIESNNSYAGSLDLINGKLVEQLELVEKMSDEQLKQQAKKFLDDNYAQIADADKIVNDNKSTSVELLYGTAFDNEKNKDFIRNLIAKAQEQGIDLGLDNYVNAPNWNPIINIEEAIRDGVNGKGWDIWQLLGFNYKKEQWTGESSTGITTEGTLEERLKALQDFRKLVVDNYADLGMSEADSLAYVKLLDAAIAELNSTENQNAILLDKKAKASQQYFNGEISRAEYLKIVYGIEEDITAESNKWTNNIQDVKGKYDDLISKLEELRDLQKESTEWEEKKLAVMEAEQALENARNEATVRRFNQATGQWEWQTDEKKIAEAEKNLEQAQLNLQEAAYSNIIEQLEKGDATNESILAILQEVAPLLGADNDFVDAVINAFKDKTGVDITKPAISNFDAAQNYINEKGLKESDREKWTEDKTFEKLFNALTDEEKSKLKGKSYDSGGVANGLGVMAKATAQPESVNDPELTRKILSPVSNAEFNRYVRDMGIMFERSHQYAQAPIIERVGGATDNRIDNSGQINFAGGLTVGADQRGSSLDQVLAMFGIMNNNG